MPARARTGRACTSSAVVGTAAGRLSTALRSRRPAEAEAACRPFGPTDVIAWIVPIPRRAHRAPRPRRRAGCRRAAAGDCRVRGSRADRGRAARSEVRGGRAPGERPRWPPIARGSTISIIPRGRRVPHRQVQVSAGRSNVARLGRPLPRSSRPVGVVSTGRSGRVIGGRVGRSEKSSRPFSKITFLPKLPFSQNYLSPKIFLPPPFCGQRSARGGHITTASSCPALPAARPRFPRNAAAPRARAARRARGARPARSRRARRGRTTRG